MAKLKIFTYPDSVLAKKAKPIARVDKSYFKLADDMLETMYDAPGIGLAANQVGLLERIIVVDTEYDRYDPEEEEDPPAEFQPEAGTSEVLPGGVILQNKKPIVLINPEIIYREGEILFREGCLSVPEYSAEVKRSEKIKVQFQTIDGLTKSISAEGLLAVCFQHELDHLDGRLFIERLSSLKKELARKKLVRQRADRGEPPLDTQEGVCYLSESELDK